MRAYTDPAKRLQPHRWLSQGRGGDTKAGKAAPVKMLIQFSTLDERSARLHDPANVVALGEKLASRMYGCIA